MTGTTPNEPDHRVQLVHFDSGELPEVACTNQLVLCRMGARLYCRAGDDWRAAVRWAVKELKRGPGWIESGGKLSDEITDLRSEDSPRVITVVLASYADGFEIDFESITASGIRGSTHATDFIGESSRAIRHRVLADVL